MEADDNDVSAEYAYEVLATAEGGATASIEGYKFIETVCVSDLVSSFSKSFSFDLPTAGVTLEQFPSAATEYATAPPSSSDYLPMASSARRATAIDSGANLAHRTTRTTSRSTQPPVCSHWSTGRR
jgi:hypothetical protein